MQNRTENSVARPENMKIEGQGQTNAQTATQTRNEESQRLIDATKAQQRENIDKLTSEIGEQDSSFTLFGLPATVVSVDPA